MGMLLGIGLGGGPRPHMLVPAVLGAAGGAYLAAARGLGGKARARIGGTAPHEGP